MKTKHTPGEWILSKCGDPKVLIGEKYNSNTDAEFTAFVTHSTTEVEKALVNAKLIAAAPEMLEALIAISGAEAWINDGIVKRQFQKVYKAIKKATE